MIQELNPLPAHAESIGVAVLMIDNQQWETQCDFHVFDAAWRHAVETGAEWLIVEGPHPVRVQMEKLTAFRADWLEAEEVGD